MFAARINLCGRPGSGPEGKKLQRARLTARPWRRLTALLFAAWAWGAAGGCGIAPPGGGPAADDATIPGLTGNVLPDPPSDDSNTAKLVVLDWTGGSPNILSTDVSDTDFSFMLTDDGGSLEGDAAELQDAVRERMEEILAAIQPAEFRIITGEAEGHPGATVVYFTGDLGEGGPGQAGQTRLDQCDLQEAGDIVVWGGSLLSLGDEFSFDEWVNMMANVAAHEVGHTVGFFHPDAFMDDLTDYERSTEVMLAVRTLSALRGPQGFVVPQETCPSNIAARYGGVAYGLSTDSTTRPAAKSAVSTSRAACVCRIDTNR